jgi:predicted site-specific integrase-resolvase
VTDDDAMLSEWLPQAGAAKLLGVSFDTVVRRRKMGRLQGRRDDRGRWLVQVPATERTMAMDAAELPVLRARIVELERDRNEWRRQAQVTAATLAQLAAALPDSQRD